MGPWRALLLVAALMAVFAFPADAAACSCVPPDEGQSRAEQLREDIRASDAALVGRLLSVRTVGDFRAFFRYRILHVVKGPRRLQPGRILTVRSASNGALCGLPQTTGRRYGLVLDGRSDGWWGNLCQVYAPRLMRAQGGRDAGRAGGSAGCR